MDVNSLIWIFLAVFMIHNFEEIILLESWFNKTYPKIKHLIPRKAKPQVEGMKNTSTAQFSFAVFILFITAVFLLWLTIITGNYIYFLGLNIFFALNLCTHPIQALLLRCYVPGVLTAILLILPYNIYLFYNLFQAQLIDAKTIVNSLPIMAFLVGLLFVSHILARKWIK